MCEVPPLGVEIMTPGRRVPLPTTGTSYLTRELLSYQRQTLPLPVRQALTCCGCFNRVAVLILRVLLNEHEHHPKPKTPNNTSTNNNNSNTTPSRFPPIPRREALRQSRSGY